MLVLVYIDYSMSVDFICDCTLWDEGVRTFEELIAPSIKEQASPSKEIFKGPSFSQPVTHPCVVLTDARIGFVVLIHNEPRFGFLDFVVE